MNIANSNRIIELIAIDSNSVLESLALRSVLESWGILVNLHFIAKSTDLIECVNKIKASSIVVISCHGTEKGIGLPTLASQIGKDQPYLDNLTASDLSAFLSLPDCLVINTGCKLGNALFSETFLNSGCRAYIAVDDYPEASATLLYLIQFFYEYHCNQKSIGDSHAKASGYDKETSMFKLYQRHA